MAFAAHVGFALHRHVHDAENGPMRVDQSDIDREFAVAIDELLGAVKRVDQPVASATVRAPRTTAGRLLRR